MIASTNTEAARLDWGAGKAVNVVDHRNGRFERSTCFLTDILPRPTFAHMSAATVKKNLYFPESMLDEMKREAERLDRSLSWVVIQAWRLARENIHDFPAYPLYEPRPELEEGTHAA